MAYLVWSNHLKPFSTRNKLPPLLVQSISSSSILRYFIIPSQWTSQSMELSILKSLLTVPMSNFRWNLLESWLNLSRLSLFSPSFLVKYPLLTNYLTKFLNIWVCFYERVPLDVLQDKSPFTTLTLVWSLFVLSISNWSNRFVISLSFFSTQPKLFSRNLSII